MNYILLLLIAIGINIWLSIFSWKRKHNPGVTAFLLLMICEVFWLISIVFMLLSPTVKTALFWLRLEFAAIAFIPVLLIVFVTQFRGSRLINRTRVLSLIIIPVLTQFVVWTDEKFHLFYKEVYIIEKNNLMLIQSWKPGVWFTIHSVYSFTLVFIALIWLFLHALRHFKAYQGQSIGIILGTLAMAVPNIALVIGIIPASAIVLPFSFVVTNICLAWAIFRYKFFKVIPIARNRLIDTMIDGMIVLDSHNSVVDLNPAVLDQDLISVENPIGKTAKEVFTCWEEVKKIITNPEIKEIEISVLSNKNRHFYDVQISELLDINNELAGRLMLFRNITERKNIEFEKDSLLNTLDIKNKELQQALLEIKTLGGLIPICANCKKIRDDKGYWNQIESYIEKHSEAQFSHSICPVCAEELYQDSEWYQKLKKEGKA